MTLIELLIVVVILGILVAAVLPVLTPTTNSRRIREASRGLNTYITLAQSQAVAKNRPYGIGLRKLSQDTGVPNDRPVCLEVFMVEQPPAYTGFSDGSMVQIANNSSQLSTRFIRSNNGQAWPFPTVLARFCIRGPSTTGGGSANSLPQGWDVDLFPDGVIRPGDILEIGEQRFEFLRFGIVTTGQTRSALYDAQNQFYIRNRDNLAKPDLFVLRPIESQGNVFVPVFDDFGARMFLTVTSAGQNQLYSHSQGLMSPAMPISPSHLWSEAKPYRIFRQPTPTSVAPYQLPEGTAIDLQASGIEGDAPFVVENAGVDPSSNVGTRNNDDPIYIMFSPEEAVEAIRYNRGGDGTSVGPVDYRTVRPTENISLLIGVRENLPVDTTLSISAGQTEAEREAIKAKVNWTNLECRWINIGSRSGAIVTTENAFIDPETAAAAAIDLDGTAGVDPLDIRREQIRQARAYAREMIREGGN